MSLTGDQEEFHLCLRPSDSSFIPGNTNVQFRSICLDLDCLASMIFCTSQSSVWDSQLFLVCLLCKNLLPARAYYIDHLWMSRLSTRHRQKPKVIAVAYNDKPVEIFFLEFQKTQPDCIPIQMMGSTCSKEISYELRFGVIRGCLSFVL